MSSPAADSRPVPNLPKHGLIPDLGDFNENIDDVDQGAYDYVWNKRRALFLSVCAVSAAVCIALWGLEFAYYGTVTRTVNSKIFVYPLVVFACPIVLYASFKTQMRHLFMQQIAAVIGFGYESTGSLRTVHGKFFELGSGPKIQDVLTGVYQGCPIRIFNYNFTVQQGRSSHTEYYTIFALAFDGALPDIALAPKSFLSAASLRSAPSASTRITLEGDFNEHFNLYAPTGFEIEIREIFQPDLMTYLIDKCQSYRIEIAGNNLYVVCPLITNKAKFLAAHELTDILFVDVVPRLRAAAKAPAAV